MTPALESIVRDKHLGCIFCMFFLGMVQGRLLLKMFAKAKSLIDAPTDDMKETMQKPRLFTRSMEAQAGPRVQKTQVEFCRRNSSCPRPALDTQNSCVDTWAWLRSQRLTATSSME